MYVGVHADGPMRVLCFQDTRDEYTAATAEDAAAATAAKLQRMEARLQARSLPLSGACCCW